MFSNHLFQFFSIIIIIVILSYHQIDAFNLGGDKNNPQCLFSCPNKNHVARPRKGFV